MRTKIFFTLSIFLFIFTNKNNYSQIKITNPKSFDTLIAGSEISISWEGTELNEKVKIEFSENNGKNWNLITDDATNLNYLWKIPTYINSKFCKIKLTNSNIRDIYNTNPVLEWLATYGSSGEEVFLNLKHLNNELYILGQSRTNDLDLDSLKELFNIYYLNINKDGSVKKIIGKEESKALAANSNLLKYSDSIYFGFNIVELIWYPKYGKERNTDVNICKMDSNFKTIDNYFFGGTGEDYFSDAVIDKDSNLLILSSIYSKDLDVECNNGKLDAWLINIDINGKILKQMCLGSVENEMGGKIIKTNDKGYLISLRTSSDKFIYGKSYGDWNATIIKLDSNLIIEWGKTFGGENFDEIRNIIETKDNMFYLVGYTSSQYNDIIEPKGEKDAWILKVSNNGEMLWTKNFGGFYDDEFTDIIELDNGQLILTGFTFSPNGQLIKKYRESDAFILKMDQEGNIIWQNTLGGNLHDYLYKLVMHENSIYLAGLTGSNDGTLIEQNLNRKVYTQYNDIWLVKLNFERYENYTTVTEKNFSIFPKIIIQDTTFEFIEKPTISPNPTNDYIDVKFVLNKKTELKYEIYNLIGQKVLFNSFGFLENGSNVQNIDLKILPIGFYNIKLFTNEEEFIIKFLKTI